MNPAVKRSRSLTSDWSYFCRRCVPLLEFSCRINQHTSKQLKYLKTQFAFCIFCLQVWAPGPRRAVRWGEPGRACNSCEKPSDLPFLTLQQPTRGRFMTSREGRGRDREEEGRRKEKSGHGRRRHKQTARGREKEINRGMNKDGGAERSDRASEMNAGWKIHTKKKERKRGTEIEEDIWHGSALFYGFCFLIEDERHTSDSITHTHIKGAAVYRQMEGTTDQCNDTGPSVLHVLSEGEHHGSWVGAGTQ